MRKGAKTNAAAAGVSKTREERELEVGELLRRRARRIDCFTPLDGSTSGALTSKAKEKILQRPRPWRALVIEDDLSGAA